MTSSGTYAFSPHNADILLDAFERIQVRSSSITQEHMVSAAYSAQMVLVRWANRGVNLWAVDQQVVPLNQGQITYDVPSNTVMMLETVLRTYQLSTAEDFTPAFATTLGDTEVTVTLADHGFVVDGWFQVVIPVAIGGLIIQGFYQVTSVTSTSTFTFDAASAATATAASGGTVPSFAMTAGDATVTTTLTAHGYVAGETFTVQISTTVGGVVLQGDYTITSVPTADTFTFEATYSAGSTETVSENDGDTQIAGQDSTTQPIDRLLTPMSRTDYAAIANKTYQGIVTSYYFDRTISPTVTLWLSPDANGPYELRYNRMRQLQDAALIGSQTMDMPYRFLEAFTAALAAHLAIKWRPEAFDKLAEYAQGAWDEAAYEDRQRVQLSVTPDLSGYYR